MSVVGILEDRQAAARELIEYSAILMELLKPINMSFPKTLHVAARRITYTRQLSERRRSLNILRNGIAYIRTMLPQWSTDPAIDVKAVDECVLVIEAQLSKLIFRPA